MYRHALTELKQWAEKAVPKPLILRGARQVGKSTLVQLLAKEIGYELIEVNLEKKNVNQFNNEGDFSVEKTLQEIEIITRKKIPDNALLFLDEIQAQPSALNALRYFYEDRPGLRVIAAGSLLEVAIRQSEFGMPVGRVEYYYLGPMTFCEFLLAKGEDVLVEQIGKIDLYNLPSLSLHNRAIELLREYYFIGGMPEVVKNYVSDGDFVNAREIQNNLIQTYKDDIPKYSRNQDYKHALSVLNYCSHKLGKKVIYSHISKGVHSSKLREAIELLSLANIIYKTCHNTCSGFPLSVGVDEEVFKLYFIDVGLYNCTLDLEWSDLYSLSPDQLLIKGNIAEQFVSQHLAFRYPKKELSQLYYWLRDGKSNAAEVDFVLSHKSHLYPLEVKSGSSGRLKSLWQLVSDKNLKYALRADLSMRNKAYAKISQSVITATGTKQISCELVGIPLYAIENLNNILSQLNEK
jgi:predicted AAA+ superfamily ATPase